MLSRRYVPALLLFLAVCACSHSHALAAADSGVRHEARFEGTMVSYQDYGPKDAVPLVFIHGWACDSSFWRLQVPEFSGDYRMILLDLPGFGQSGKPLGIAYSMPYFARALRAVLEDAGVETPVLIGHSMGYAVIRQYMIDYPGAVAAICNVDGLYFRIPEDPQALAALKRGMEGIMAGMTGPDRPAAVKKFIRSTFYGKTPPELAKKIEAVMASAEPYPANSALNESFALEQWKHVSFSVPALSLYASSPYLAPDEEAYQRSVFPNLHFEVWDDCGHYLMLEKPGRFNSALQDFLRKLKR